MRGTYTLILSIRKPATVRFGMLGTARLEAGYYLYTGSALGRGAVSLEWRLSRHASSRKKKRWHVDYLTSCPSCRLVGAVYLSSKTKFECRVNSAVRENLSLQPLIPHLGATDCKCDGHLLRVNSHRGEGDLKARIERVYSEFGYPKIWRPTSDGLSFFPSFQKGVPENSD